MISVDSIISIKKISKIKVVKARETRHPTNPLDGTDMETVIVSNVVNQLIARDGLVAHTRLIGPVNNGCIEYMSFCKIQWVSVCCNNSYLMARFHQRLDNIGIHAADGR